MKLGEAWTAYSDERMASPSSQPAALQKPQPEMLRGERPLTNEQKALLVSSPPTCESQIPYQVHVVPGRVPKSAKEEPVSRPCLQILHNEKERLQGEAE